MTSYNKIQAGKYLPLRRMSMVKMVKAAGKSGIYYQPYDVN